MRDLWYKSLKEIEKKVSRQILDTWFRPISIHSVSPGRVEIAVPNKFYKDWLAEHYHVLIRDSVSSIAGRPLEVSWVVDESLSLTDSNPEDLPDRKFAPSAPEPEPLSCTFLNPRYTFSSFVVGSCNQFAHAACVAVAETPAYTYNPLFIYAGVGLGKTHLMHAIGNYLCTTRNSTRLAYISSETFVNDLILSIQRDRTAEFRAKYRNIDVLLMDDIQFLAGKDRSQEEFFHTFNTLFDSRKQIVLSCDRYPRDIPTLEERLRSRFEWGLVADMQPPDLETKVAILNQKAEERGALLPQDVSLFIAAKIKSNVRELEGCLNRLMALSSLSGRPLSLALAEETLQDFFSRPTASPDLNAIQNAVAEYFHLRPGDLKSKRRTRSIALPRQVAMYLCRQLTSASLPEIGRFFGGKDHTTVIHACNKILNSLAKDPKIAASVNDLLRTLKT
ncbi:MAG: chromosomal replication initiator protein DnaA [Candidatus Tectomicrobia bacterium]|uniref:Chromosomal replication initiator protein DnaA n=1 Tax=Tectimicrobiota bacterium TaxID=2528274 RepID=A0A932GQY4_UNCTE|nr:chromosomal replication initiator protein DnaA [Candidatus Tectomicrobia bacterium]